MGTYRVLKPSGAKVEPLDTVDVREVYGDGHNLKEGERF